MLGLSEVALLTAPKPHLNLSNVSEGRNPCWQPARVLRSSLVFDEAHWPLWGKEAKEEEKRKRKKIKKYIYKKIVPLMLTKQSASMLVLTNIHHVLLILNSKRTP